MEKWKKAQIESIKWIIIGKKILVSEQLQLAQ